MGWPAQCLYGRRLHGHTISLSQVCEGLFPAYQLPNGKMAYMYYNGGQLMDEVGP
jgi:hypothetical protein